MRWPAWWVWELELTPHVLKRMVDREFTELDLRQMLEDASSLRPDVEEGRWVVTARHRRRAWEIVVKADEDGPGKLSLPALNRVLTRLGQPRLGPEELGRPERRVVRARNDLLAAIAREQVLIGR